MFGMHVHVVAKRKLQWGHDFSAMEIAVGWAAPIETKETRTTRIRTAFMAPTPTPFKASTASRVTAAHLSRMTNLEANPYFDREYFLERNERIKRQTPWIQNRLSSFAFRRPTIGL